MAPALFIVAMFVLLIYGVRRTVPRLPPVDPESLKAFLAEPQPAKMLTDTQIEVALDGTTRFIGIGSFVNYLISVPNDARHIKLQFVGQPGSFSDPTFVISIGDEKLDGIVWGDRLNFTCDFRFMRCSHGARRLSVVIDIKEMLFSPIVAEGSRHSRLLSGFQDSNHAELSLNIAEGWHPLALLDAPQQWA
jgi:hypothetical protein